MGLWQKNIKRTKWKMLSGRFSGAYTCTNRCRHVDTNLEGKTCQLFFKYLSYDMSCKTCSVNNHHINVSFM